MTYKKHNLIGGTAANVIAHGKVYNTDVTDLWRQFTGRTDKPDLSETLPVRIGQATESLNAEWLAKTRDIVVDTKSATNQLYTHSNGFMIAQIDGMVYENGETGLFEAKHTRVGKKMDELIDLYYPQIQHYLCVMDLPWAYLSVFFGNSTHNYEKIYTDPRYIEALIKKEKRFWDAVQQDIEPVAGKPIKPEKELWSKYVRKVDMTTNNRFADLEERYHLTIEHHTEFEEITGELKDMMPEDAKEIYGKRLSIRRSRNGGRRIWDIKKDN